MSELVASQINFSVVSGDAGELPNGSDNPALVYVASLAKGSRRAMARSLQTVAEIFIRLGGHAVPDHKDLWIDFPWWKLRYQHTSAIRSSLQESYAPATANKALSALRQVLKRCWRLGLMTVEDYQSAADVDAIKGESLPSGRDISAGEVQAMLGNCTQGDRNIDYRDAAVLVCLLVVFLRAEVSGLTLADYTPDDLRLTIRRAKRNKDRGVYLPEAGARAVNDWLSKRGDQQGPLFLSINKGDRILASDKHLSTQAIWVLVERRAKAVGIDDISPHDFRRTFVGDLLDAGADISTVQKLAGHANPATTARYDRRGDRAKKDAISRLHIPYRR